MSDNDNYEEQVELREQEAYNAAMSEAGREADRVQSEHGAYVAELEARIAELEAQQRWIPVSERLPEKSGTYLVWYKHYLEMANFDWISTKWQICYTNWITDIDYWMPLPVPPIMYGKVCEE